jgi:hypothetical protein
VRDLGGEGAALSDEQMALLMLVIGVAVVSLVAVLMGLSDIPH